MKPYSKTQNKTYIELPNKIRVLPSPWRITFDTNPDDCNLHCIMCEEFSQFSTVKEDRRLKDPTIPKKRRMDIRLIEKVLAEVAPYGTLKEIIPSTMGEPLLYKNFEDILGLCKKYNVKLNLTTNGTFPRKSVQEWAKLIVPVCSDIKISWNGVTKETAESIMKGINFDKTLSNLREFIKIRDEIFNQGGNFCRVTLQVTFMELNYQEFPELVKLAAEFGVNRIKGHHLWTHFPEIKNLSMKKNRDSIQRWNAIVKKMYEYAEKYRLPNGEKVILDNIYELPLPSENTEINHSKIPPDWICPFLGQEAWVAWNGRFNPCCAPDNLRLQLGDFGNLYEKTLPEIWNSENYNNLVKNYLKNDVCKSCNMRRPREDVYED